MRSTTGTAQKGFYLNQLESVLVCVPPVKEQNRLTTKIQQILSSIQNVDKVPSIRSGFFYEKSLEIQHL